MSLATLPREIRDQIYRWVFESPSSPPAVILHESRKMSTTRKRCYQIRCADKRIQWTLSLAILRTSKFFYAECRHLLWHYNALDLSSDPSQVTRWTSQGLYDARVWQHLRKQVRMVILKISFPCEQTPEAQVKDAVKELESWVATGKLEVVTLNLVKNLDWEIWSGRNNFEHHWGDFFKAARDMYLSKCRRILAVEFCGGGEVKGKDPNPDLEELHMLSRSFGGQLICDGVLRFEDGIEVVNRSKT